MSVERLRIATDDNTARFQELPPKRQGAVDSADYEFADSLRANPGEWALYKTHSDRQKPENDRQRIQRARGAFDGPFEVATRITRQEPKREWSVFVRYSPD